MYWLLGIIGGLIGFVLLILLIGALLPKAHTASRTAHIQASPRQVFDIIADYRSFPSWRSDVREVKDRHSQSGRPSWVEVTRHGELPLEVIESDPPRKLVGKIADPKLPFGGTWTWQIAPDNENECDVTITEDGEIYNPFFRFMARFIFGYTATMERNLRDLSARCERADK